MSHYGGPGPSRGEIQMVCNEMQETIHDLQSKPPGFVGATAMYFVSFDPLIERLERWIKTLEHEITKEE